MADCCDHDPAGPRAPDAFGIPQTGCFDAQAFEEAVKALLAA